MNAQGVDDVCPGHGLKHWTKVVWKCFCERCCRYNADKTVRYPSSLSLD